MSRVQGSEEEDSAEGYFLPCTDLQAPDHGKSETEDHEVNKKIRDAVPAVEVCLVDAGAVGDCLVPVVGDGAAFEYGGEQADDEVAGDDGFGAGEEYTEPADYAEEAVVQEDDGRLESYGGAEVDYLNGHEYLFDNSDLNCCPSVLEVGMEAKRDFFLPSGTLQSSLRLLVLQRRRCEALIRLGLPVTNSRL